MKLAILDADTLGPGLDLDQISSLGTCRIYSSTQPAEILSRCADLEAVITNKVVFDGPVLETLPRLRFIGLTATGTNNVDLSAARRLGIAVTNVPHYSTDSVAQHALALVLGLWQKLTSYRQHALSGAWSRSGQFNHFGPEVHELKGRRWGLVGLGAIGRRLGGLAEALGMEVVWTSVSGAERPEPWPQVPLETLIRTSSVVSLQTPLTPQSRGLLGPRELAWFRPEAVLVNVGRGGVIDERALAEALDRGQLAGAGLDVLTQEPPPADHPLLSLNRPERLILTPHMAWSALESRQRCLAEVALNLRAWQEGQSRNRVESGAGD